MSRQKITILMFIALAVIAFAVFDTFCLPSGRETQSLDLATIISEVVPELGTTADTVSFFTDRVLRHPQDVVSLTILGQRYIDQARETGDVAGYQRAESALLKEIADLLSGRVSSRLCPPRPERN